MSSLHLPFLSLHNHGDVAHLPSLGLMVGGQPGGPTGGSYDSRIRSSRPGLEDHRRLPRRTPGKPAEETARGLFHPRRSGAGSAGSFLEEQAEKLGISIKGEFARLALSAQSPTRLGERCTVFMERDVTGWMHKGETVPHLVAGLAYSIALNYLNRVVRGRKIGKVIYFQGGTAYNDAVTAAFASLLGKKITVPPYNGVMGAIGMALI